MKRVAVALLLVAATLSTVMPAAADSVTTVDADHDLSTRDSIDTYEEEGVASATKLTPDMRLTVAENHDDVGLDGWHWDRNRRYLRVQYNESIQRTVRVFIPSEYWFPFASNVDSFEGNSTAQFRITDDGRYTSVTIRFDGKTDAVFPVEKLGSGYFWAKDEVSRATENATGYEPPRIGSGGEWHYVPDSALNGSASYPINASSGATVQYDTDARNGDETWLSVPTCDGGSAPVCVYTKSGDEGKEYILSRTTDAPPVRYKMGEDPVEEAKSGWADLQLIPSKLLNDIKGLFGGESAA